MATTTVPISNDVKIAAVFSELIYEAHKTSGIPGGTSHDRLSRVILDPNVRKVIGNEWNVHQTSTQDFALFVNENEKQAFFVCRGSLDSRDWLGSNFGGGAGVYDGRVKTILSSDAMKQANILVKHGYELTFTGHSLAGSLSTALDAITQLGKVITFNAPELSFQFGKYSEGRLSLAKNNKEIHFRFEHEIVSLLNPTSDTRPFHERGSCAVTLPYDGSFIAPHGMKYMVSVITNGVFEGVYASDVYGFEPKGRCISAGVQLNENQNHELSLGKVKVFEAEVQKTVHHQNLFFEIETSTLILRSKSGEVLSSTCVDTVHASKHIKQAFATIKEVMKSEIIDYLSVSGKGSASAKTVAMNTIKAGGFAMVSSVAEDAVQSMAGSALGGFATGLGGAAVTSLNQAVHSHHAEALRTMYVHVANAIVRQAVELPLTFGSETFSAVGQIFGSRCLSAQVERQSLDFSTRFGGVGIHLDHNLETIALNNGRTMQRETHSFGIHGKTPGVDVAVGLHSGFEVTSAVTTTATDGLSVTVWSDRCFQNELRLSLKFGQTYGSWRIIPAQSSHTRTCTYERYEDGRDLYSFSTRTSEKPTLSVVTGQLQDSSSHPSAADSSCMPTPDTADAHNKLAQTLFGDLPPDTVNVHVTGRNTVEHVETRRKWIFFKKTKEWKEVYEHGFIEKQTTSSTSGNVPSHGGEGAIPAEVFTKLKHVTSVDTFQNKDGSRIQQSNQSSKTIEMALCSRADGGEYSQFSSDVTTDDGSHVKQVEIDHNHLEVKTTQRTRVEQPATPRKNLVRTFFGQRVTPRKFLWDCGKEVVFVTHESHEEYSYVLGSGHSTKTSKPVSTRSSDVPFSKKLQTEQRVIERVFAFKDLRKETINGVETCYQHGVRRAESGTETEVETKTLTETKNLYVHQVQTENTTVREYTADSITPGSCSAPLNYQNVPTMTASKTLEVTPGYFTDTTVTTEVKNNVELSRSSKARLNQGGQRVLGIFVTEALDRAYDLLTRSQKGDSSVSARDVSEALANLSVNICEGYFIGLSGQLAACTKELYDAVPYAVITIACAFFARKGIAFLSKKPNTESEQDMTLHVPSSKTNDLIHFCGEITRCALQLFVVGREIACGSSMMFCLSQMVTSFEKICVAINKEGLSFGTIFKSVWKNLPDIVTSGVASATSWAATTIACRFIVPTSGILTTSIATVIVPIVAGWAAAKLWRWYFPAGTVEQDELDKLLRKYDLPLKAETTCVKEAYKKLCLQHHPDKTGSANSSKFQEVHCDFKRIFDLQILIETATSNKETKETPDYKKRFVLRQFLSRLAEHFRKIHATLSHEDMEDMVEILDKTLDMAESETHET